MTKSNETIIKEFTDKLDEHGVTVVDDHHLGGTLKHLYTTNETSEKELLVLGIYGFDEVSSFDGQPRSVLFHGHAPYPQIGKARMTIYKPSSNNKDHYERELGIEWKVHKGKVRLEFDDMRKDFAEKKEIRNFWDPVDGVDTQRNELRGMYDNIAEAALPKPAVPVASNFCSRVPPSSK